MRSYHFQNEELADYSRQENGNWLYSQKTIDLVYEYWQKFPKLFEILNTSNQNQKGNSDFIFESDFGYQFDDGENSPEQKPLAQIVKWLREQPHNKALRRSFGSEALDRNSIQKVIQAVQILKVSYL